MSLKPEEMEAKLKSYDEKLGQIEKNFQLKLEAAQAESTQWKTVAEQHQAEAKKFKEETEKIQKDLQESKKKAQEAEVVSFVDEMIKGDILIPAQKDGVVAFMRSLASEGEVHKFQEKDGSTRSHSQLSLFKELISKLPKRKNLTTFSKSGDFRSETPDNGAGEPQHFQEVIYGGKKQNMQVDDVDLATKAFEYQAEQQKLGRSIGYDDALIAVEKMSRN